MRDSVQEGLAEEESDVVEGGSPDGETLLVVPNNVYVVWTQTLAFELRERRQHPLDVST